MTGNTANKQKNQKIKNKTKIKKHKKIQVGEPSIAFLEKMPKCQTNKNQKTKKRKRKHIFLENNYLLKNNYFFMYFFHAKMFCYRLLAKDILSKYKN